MNTAGKTERAGMPKNHQTNHQNIPPIKPMTDVPAVRPERVSNSVLVSRLFLHLHFTCYVRLVAIDQDDVGDCRKCGKTHYEHFNLKVAVSSKGNEQTNEKTQGAQYLTISRA